MDTQARTSDSFRVGGNVTITRTAQTFDPAELAGIAELVDRRRGGVLSSGMEYPGRYTRWHMAYVNPPVEIACRGRQVTARALNDRGLVLIPALRAAMLRAGTEQPPSADGPVVKDTVTVYVPEGEGTFTEEERSRRPTVFSVLREITAAFGCPDPHLGLYGAFGYDLAFQFEPLRLAITRPDDQRDLILHLPDEIRVVDLRRDEAIRYSYEFSVAGVSTEGLPRETPATPELDQGPAPRGRGRSRRSRSPAGTPRSWPRRRSASRSATSSRSSPATSSTSGARRRRASTSGCGNGTRHRSNSCSTLALLPGKEAASTWSARPRRCTCGSTATG